jgi:hypothetical protein
MKRLQLYCICWDVAIIEFENIVDRMIAILSVFLFHGLIQFKNSPSPSYSSYLHSWTIADSAISISGTLSAAE